jgi:hypothetical protein
MNNRKLKANATLAGGIGLPDIRGVGSGFINTEDPGIAL